MIAIPIRCSNILRIPGNLPYLAGLTMRVVGKAPPQVVSNCLGASQIIEQPKTVDLGGLEHFGEGTAIGQDTDVFELVEYVVANVLEMLGRRREYFGCFVDGQNIVPPGVVTYATYQIFVIEEHETPVVGMHVV